MAEKSVRPSCGHPDSEKCLIRWLQLKLQQDPDEVLKALSNANLCAGCREKLKNIHYKFAPSTDPEQHITIQSPYI